MADAPKTTEHGIAADAPRESEHLPGAPDPDSSEPQIPRIASATVGPGDVASTQPDDQQVGAGRAADARAERGEPADRTATDADGRPIIAQPSQQQQANAAGPGAQEESIEGPGYPTEDMDDVDDEDDDDEDDDEDDDDDGAEDEEFAGVEDNDDDVQAVAPPELGDAPIEDEDGDTSILGDGHADKAAWNRERIASMQTEESEHAGEDTFGSQDVLGHGDAPDTNRIGLGDAAQIAAGRTPGSSEDLGYGGGAPNEDVDPDIPGLDTGDGRLDDLTEETDEAERDSVGDATDSLDDETARNASADRQEPDLPESREFPDEGVSVEERLLADDDEDAMFGDTELGDAEDLEMEELNEIDDIANDFEDQRVADDSMDGNEERTRTRD